MRLACLEGCLILDVLELGYVFVFATNKNTCKTLADEILYSKVGAFKCSNGIFIT